MNGCFILLALLLGEIAIFTMIDNNFAQWLVGAIYLIVLYVLTSPTVEREFSDGVPTHHYSFADAVKEWLIPRFLFVGTLTILVGIPIAMICLDIKSYLIWALLILIEGGIMFWIMKPDR